LYAASKFGVVGLVRSTARVLEKANIQINALAPAVLGALTRRLQAKERALTRCRHQYRARQGSLPTHDCHSHGDIDQGNRPVSC
jgi:NAD(P)-dependent dehydrogenase (short-subunit alcohol dehydrogenase family)